MTSNPWYRRFPDNFIAGVAELSLEETGAYSLILDMIYSRVAPIEDNPRRLAMICKVSTRKWCAIRQRLIDLGKLRCEDGHLMNDRAAKELGLASKPSAEAVQNEPKTSRELIENREKPNDFYAGERGNLKPRSQSPESPPTPSGGNDVDVQVFREQVWEVFPRNLNSIFEEGLREYRKLSEEDRQSCAYGAESYRRLASEIVRQNKPEPQHKRLSGWIAKRGWVGLARVETDDDFVALEPSDPRFAAVEKFRGRALIVGGRGKATVRKTEIAEATEQAA